MVLQVSQPCRANAPRVVHLAPRADRFTRAECERCTVVVVGRLSTRVMTPVRRVIRTVSVAMKQRAGFATRIALSATLVFVPQACRKLSTHGTHRSSAVTYDAAPRTTRTTTFATLARFDGTPRWPVQSLLRDGRPDFAPALPTLCTLVGPARHVPLSEHASAVFSTASTDGRALFTFAAGRDESYNDGGAASVSDGATWVLEPGDESPRWWRGPLEPGTTSTVATGAAGRLHVGWARGETDSEPTGVVRVATFARTPGDPAFETVDEVADPLVSDLACTGARCILAWGYRDPQDVSETSSRAVFSTLGATRARRLGPPGARPLNALVPASDDLIGTVVRREGRALIPEQPGVAAVAMHRSVLEVARIGNTLYAITASAPGVAQCQPGAWTVELSRLDAGGILRDPIALATMDARPRGARLRSVGPVGEPLATWLDAPQCALDFYVLRAWRRGETRAVSSASEYDVATDGPWLSMAWRERDRLRWIRARCDTGSSPRDPQAATLCP